MRSSENHLIIARLNHLASPHEKNKSKRTKRGNEAKCMPVNSVSTELPGLQGLETIVSHGLFYRRVFLFPSSFPLFWFMQMQLLCPSPAYSLLSGSPGCANSCSSSLGCIEDTEEPLGRVVASGTGKA